MATQRERDAAKRERKRQEFDAAVADGSLVLRSMTPAERAKNPPRERPPKRVRHTWR